MMSMSVRTFGRFVLHSISMCESMKHFKMEEQDYESFSPFSCFVNVKEEKENEREKRFCRYLCEQQLFLLKTKRKRLEG
jgi:hypothetical protein